MDDVEIGALREDVGACGMLKDKATVAISLDGSVSTSTMNSGGAICIAGHDESVGVDRLERLYLGRYAP